MIERFALAALAGLMLGASCWAWSAAVGTRRRIRQARHYRRR